MHSWQHVIIGSSNGLAPNIWRLKGLKNINYICACSGRSLDTGIVQVVKIRFKAEYSYSLRRQVINNHGIDHVGWMDHCLPWRRISATRTIQCWGLIVNTHTHIYICVCLCACVCFLKCITHVKDLNFARKKSIVRLIIFNTLWYSGVLEYDLATSRARASPTMIPQTRYIVVQITRSCTHALDTCRTSLIPWTEKYTP